MIGTSEDAYKLAKEYIDQLLIHKLYVLNEMLTLHAANTNTFATLHMTPAGFVAALNPRIWLNDD